MDDLLIVDPNCKNANAIISLAGRLQALSAKCDELQKRVDSLGGFGVEVMSPHIVCDGSLIQFYKQKISIGRDGLQRCGLREELATFVIDQMAKSATGPKE